MKLERATLRTGAIALAVAGALCAAPAAWAQGKPTVENPKFQKLDTNRDGFLTMDEVRHIRQYERAFNEADENRDGKLDPSEFLKAESLHDRIVTGKYVEDSVITAKVKAALLKEPQLKSLDVSVETYRGEVLLSGFVRDEEQRRKAMQVAIAVNGVATVKDAMIVR